MAINREERQRLTSVAMLCYNKKEQKQYTPLQQKTYENSTMGTLLL